MSYFYDSKYLEDKWDLERNKASVMILQVHLLLPLMHRPLCLLCFNHCTSTSPAYGGSCFADGDGRLYGIIGGGSGSPLSKTKFKTCGKKTLLCKKM